VEHGVILVDGVERDRSWIIQEVERLRHVALEQADKRKNDSQNGSKRGRLFKLIRMFSAAGSSDDAPPATTSCPHCNHDNPLKANYCQKCGGRMSLDDVEGELSKGKEPVIAGRVGIPIRNRAFKQSDYMAEQAVMMLRINEDDLHIPIRRNLFLGRDDSHVGITAVVDLRPYGAYRMGVSHRHAEIFLTDNDQLEITDLGSSNGTYLNEEMLNPLHAYRLRDGDRIHLGDLEIHVFFKIRKTRAKST
jgi:hypothetical protein